jgi:hypothetical protein
MMGAGFLILTKLSQEEHRCLYATVEMAWSGAKSQARLLQVISCTLLNQLRHKNVILLRYSRC